jgi:phospholipase D1/2
MEDSRKRLLTRQNPSITYTSGAMGCTVQFLRSCSGWSFGLPTKDSIYQAYLHAIRSAEKFVYIENQFFVSSAREDHSSDAPKNLICKILAERIIRAHKEQQRFRVYVVMPIMPAFEAGDLQSPEAYVCRLTMHLQFQTICRGDNSLRALVTEGTGDAQAWKKYIIFCGLRQGPSS